MVFARFVGCNVSEHFTTGKMYFAKERYRGNSVDHTHLVLHDDDGKLVEIDAGRGWFEYFEEIYAVWLGTGKGLDLQLGDVMVFDDADGDMLKIVGGGYFRRDSFEVLDWTNMLPGMVVLDKESQRWVSVLRINDEYGLNVESISNNFRNPTDFRFAVVGGNIADFPILFCKDDTGVNLTHGKCYCPIAIHGDLVVIEDDEGDEQEMLISRFYIDFLQKGE